MNELNLFLCKILKIQTINHHISTLKNENISFYYLPQILSKEPHKKKTKAETFSLPFMTQFLKKFKIIWSRYILMQWQYISNRIIQNFVCFPLRKTRVALKSLDSIVQLHKDLRFSLSFRHHIMFDLYSIVLY